MLYYLILLILSTSLLSISLGKALLKESDNDLYFLLFCNCIFLISTTAFYFTFQELFLSLCSSFFLLGYALLLLVKLKKINHKLLLIDYPYFLFTLGLFCYMIFIIFF